MRADHFEGNSGPTHHGAIINLGFQPQVKNLNRPFCYVTEKGTENIYTVSSHLTKFHHVCLIYFCQSFQAKASH